MIESSRGVESSRRFHSSVDDVCGSSTKRTCTKRVAIINKSGTEAVYDCASTWWVAIFNACKASKSTSEYVAIINDFGL